MVCLQSGTCTMFNVNNIKVRNRVSCHMDILITLSDREKLNWGDNYAVFHTRSFHLLNRVESNLLVHIALPGWFIKNISQTLHR